MRRRFLLLTPAHGGKGRARGVAGGRVVATQLDFELVIAGRGPLEAGGAPGRGG